MIRPEIEKLLGGYATGTLTPEERRALFAAALEDQELFDTLAREQALRDLLAEPDARARLLAALGERRPVVVMPWWRRPAVAAIAAGMMVAAVALTFWPVKKPLPAPERPVLVAQVKEAPAPVAPPAQAKPVVASAPAKPSRRVAAPRPKENATPEKAAPPAEKPPTPKPPETAVLKLPEVPALRTYSPQPNVLPPPESAVAKLPEAPPAPRTFSFRSDALARRVEPGSQLPQVRIGRTAALVKAEQSEPVLRYTIVHAAAGGAWVPVEGTAVKTGESVRFRVEPQETGWLELIEFDPAGKPRVAASAGANAGTPCDLPAAGLTFDKPGRRQFLLRLAGSRNSFARIQLDVTSP